MSVDERPEHAPTSDEAATGRAGFPWLAVLPLVAFLALAILFATQLLSGRDASELPSALIGKVAPALDLPTLDRTPATDGAEPVAPAPVLPDPRGRVTLVNFWASWCAPCRAEHPLLMDLARRDDIVLTGIAYKDAQEASVGFLDELGNPFGRIGVDAEGRAGLDWGLTGVPETFVVGPDGTVRYRHAGPILDRAALDRLNAEIEAAKSA